MDAPSQSSHAARQMRLPLAGPPSLSRGDFIVSPSNRAAVEMVDAWPAWPGGRLALVGPEGCGKSHLGRAWAKRTGAVIVDASHGDFAEVENRQVLFEDADRRSSGDNLFHLINMADSGTSLLITARSEPQSWPIELPDLKSRVNALLTAKIEPADDVVLEGLLRRFFKDRHIKPAEEVYAYLLHRIERSAPALKEAVSRLDDLAYAESREITRALARQIIEHDETLDLFD